MPRAPATKRRRRGGDEVRALMLEAARSCFAEDGPKATTRQIAERAGVSETLLFRHFATKQQLFETAVLEPLDSFLERFTGGTIQRIDPDDDPESLLSRFVIELYDLCCEHRELLLALPMEEVGRPVPQASFARLEQMADVISDRFRLEYDTAVAVRAAVIAVAMMALFEQHLFPVGAQAGRDRVVAELTGLLVGGLVHRTSTSRRR